MPALLLPPDTSVTTKSIGNFLNTAVVIEAVSVEPGIGGADNYGGAKLGIALGNWRFCRFEISTKIYPGLSTIPYLIFSVWYFGTQLTIKQDQFNPTRHRWWRIQESTGYIEVSVSSNRSEWTSFAILYFTDNPEVRDLMRCVQISLAHHKNRGKGNVVFDNLNVEPIPEADPTIPRTRTLNYMRAASVGPFTGSGVRMAILDQGSTDAVRTKLGATLGAKEVSPHIDYTQYTGEYNDIVGGMHGSLVAACCLRPGTIVHDYVISGVSGLTDDSVIGWGVKLAVDSGCKVINCSFGGGLEPPGGLLRAVLQYALERNVLCFFSAGNSGTPVIAHPAQLSRYFDNVHSVGAFDERTDTKAYFSQYDPLMTGVAPGLTVRGLLPDGTSVTWSGTSASSPHAAGLALRLLTDGTFTVAQVNFALKSTRRQTAAPAAHQGQGAYDFAAALGYLYPHDVAGGTVVWSMPAALGGLKRASAGRSGSATVSLAAGIPTVARPTKTAGGRAELQAINTSTVFAGRALIYYTLGTTATALPQGKGLGGTASVTALLLAASTVRPRKHIAETVTRELAVGASAYESLRWAPIPREAQEFPFEFKPTDLRFIAQDILSRQWLHWDLPLVDVEITWNLSGPFELSAVLAPPYPDIVDIGIDEWSTFIHVEYQGIILGTGILMPFTTTQDAMSVTAVGVTSYPNGIPYLETYAEFFPDTMDVIRELWRHIQSFPNGNMGVLLPTGRMGVPLFGDAAYDDTTGELLGYERWKLSWTDFPDCGSLIDQLASSTPFDYNEVHAWKKDHSDILHGIAFGYPLIGSSRRDLRFVEGENIIEAVPVTEPDDRYASDVIVKGAGEGYNQVFAYVAANVWNRLRRVAIITDEKVLDVNMGNQLAEYELITRVLSRGVSQIVVEAFHGYASLGNYDVGDDILIEAYQPWYGDFALWHRITAIKFTPETGLVTLDVRRTDSFRFGLWIWGS